MNTDEHKQEAPERVVWKPLFGGIFEASSDGRIRRVIKTRYNQKLGEIALTNNPSHRYLKCGLILNGKTQTIFSPPADLVGVSWAMSNWDGGCPLER